MALTTAYLTSTKNLEGILTAIQTAQAPEKFTIKFLESLEYKSTNDRLIIGVLKGLRFLDDLSMATDLYYRFLDQTEGKRVLAEGTRKAYEDLFRVNIKANELSQTEVRNKLKTLTQGQKSDGVLDDMAKTFVSLCALSDWSAPPAIAVSASAREVKGDEEKSANNSENIQTSRTVSLGQLCYNIQIILPATRDSAVYDALFKSLKEHLFG